MFQSGAYVCGQVHQLHGDERDLPGGYIPKVSRIHADQESGGCSQQRHRVREGNPQTSVRFADLKLYKRKVAGS